MYNTKVRNFKKDDIDEIYIMFIALYKHLNEKGFPLALDKTSTKKIILKQLKLNYIQVFILEVDNEIAGFINISVSKINKKFISREYESIGNITELYVKEKFRGKNLSDLLITASETFFLENNVKIVQVNTMQKNTSAINFYTKVGFKQDYASFLKKL